MHSDQNYVFMFEILLLCYHYFEIVYISLLNFLCIFVLLQTKVCHWNLNSLTTYNFSKLTQCIKAYNSTYKHDFMCLSETYLDSSTPDSLLQIEGCNLVHLGHPVNIKRGAVWIYNK